MINWLISLVTLLLLCGCSHTRVTKFNRIEPFVIIPYPHKYEVESGEVIKVSLVVYNTSDGETLVPDPEKLTLAIMNLDTEDPMIFLPPFTLDGPPPKLPQPEILLQKGEKLEAMKLEAFSGDGIFLISAWGYQDVRVPIRVNKKNEI